MNTALIRDPWLYRRLHGRNGDIEAILPDTDGEPLEDAIGEHGVAVSRHHAHLPSRICTTTTPRAAAVRPRDTGLDPARRARLGPVGPPPGPERYGTFRIDYDDPLIDWQILDGDADVAPGIRTVFTPGHSPGHQSFAIGPSRRRLRLRVRRRRPDRERRAGDRAWRLRRLRARGRAGVAQAAEGRCRRARLPADPRALPGDVAGADRRSSSSQTSRRSASRPGRSPRARRPPGSAWRCTCGSAGARGTSARRRR